MLLYVYLLVNIKNAIVISLINLQTLKQSYEMYLAQSIISSHIDYLRSNFNFWSKNDRNPVLVNRSGSIIRSDANIISFEMNPSN